MPNFKVVISDPKTAKAQVFEVKDSNAQVFMGRKIGEVIDASGIGYKARVKITGGSDRAGFPMRADVMGGGKRYVLLTKGTGFKDSVSGEKRRKLVRGNTITEEIYQINAKTEPGTEVGKPKQAQK